MGVSYLLSLTFGVLVVVGCFSDLFVFCLCLLFVFWGIVLCCFIFVGLVWVLLICFVFACVCDLFGFYLCVVDNWLHLMHVVF